MNVQEIINLINYSIDNNKTLKAENKKPVTICIQGEAGCGKTSIMQQVAEAKGMTFVKLSMSQIEDVGDMLGWPIVEYKVRKYDEEDSTKYEDLWVSKDVLDTYKNLPCTSYEVFNIHRMSYATPEWLPKEVSENGMFLVLDDLTRANSQILQACMELIDRHEFISWKLPENTFICATTNPDNGRYQVSAVDTAFLTRMVTFNMEFSIDSWAKWAEMADIDSRAINFAIAYSDEIFKNDGVEAVNARSYTTFCNMIQGIKDWQNPESLALILNIAKGCFQDKDSIIGKLFTQFIVNKLDKLVPPKDLLMGDWETVHPKVISCIYNGDQYSTVIANILSTRLLNYTIKYLSTNGSKDTIVAERFGKFIKVPEKAKRIFSEDIIFNIIKQVVNACPAKTKKLIADPEIRRRLLA